MGRPVYCPRSKGLRQPSSTRGMTLIETLIALAILAVTAVVFLTAVFTNYKAATLTQERTTAESLARSQLEAIKNAAYDETPPYEYAIIDYTPVDHSEDYSIEIGVVPLPLAGDLQKVTVEISHWGKPVFAVEDYKVKR